MYAAALILIENGEYIQKEQEYYQDSKDTETCDFKEIFGGRTVEFHNITEVFTIYSNGNITIKVEPNSDIINGHSFSVYDENNEIWNIIK